MFNKKEKRFRVKSKESLGVEGLLIIVDTLTGVNYIAVMGAAALSSITPLLDENGNVVIDKVE